MQMNPEIEARFSALEKRIAEVEESFVGLMRFINAVIDSHPEPSLLFGMVYASIHELPPPEKFPGGKERRDRIVDDLLRLAARIQKRADDLSAHKVYQDQMKAKADAALQQQRERRRAKAAEEQRDRDREQDRGGPSIG